MKRWFRDRKPREQALLAVFVVLGAIIWLSAANGRFRRGLDSWRFSRNELASQDLWLDRQELIRSRSAAAVQDLDPMRTYDASRMMATLTSLSAAAGLSPAIDPPATQRGTEFTLHQVRMSFQKASLASVLKFSDELIRQAPYLNLEQITLQTDRVSADTLSASLTISAAQIETARP
jgi:hypothetical protein